MDIKKIDNEVSKYGFCLRGVVSLSGQKTGILVGNIGSALWPFFEPYSQVGENPLDDWTRKTLQDIANDVGADILFPFDGPPFHPFQRWAQEAEPVFPSPIGPLVHPLYGMWHAYRGIFVFNEEVKGDLQKSGPSPCESCEEKPCLSTCPVGAFAMTEGYDVPACTGYLRKTDGVDCLTGGCVARRACPIGQDYIYTKEMAQFHMRQFLRVYG